MNPDRLGPEARLSVDYELGMVRVVIIGFSVAGVSMKPSAARQAAALIIAAAEKAEQQMPHLGEPDGI